MTDYPSSDLLNVALEKAKTRPFFIGHALSAYQAIHNMNDAEIAKFLECPPKAIVRLALCRKPEGAAPDFRAQVERIAEYSGSNKVRLAQILREVDAFNALRSRQEPASQPGFLMAARDKSRKSHRAPRKKSK